LAAEVAQLQGKLEPARKYLAQGIEKHPADARFWQTWSNLELKAGKSREAVRLLRKGLDRVPDAVEMHWSLAVLLLGEGELREAENVIEHLRKTDLSPARLEYLTATLRLKEQRYFEARAGFESARPQLANWPELMSQCDLYLGRCYE